VTPPTLPGEVWRGERRAGGRDCIGEETCAVDRFGVPFAWRGGKWVEWPGHFDTEIVQSAVRGIARERDAALAEARRLRVEVATLRAANTYERIPDSWPHGPPPREP